MIGTSRGIPTPRGDPPAAERAVDRPPQTIDAGSREVPVTARRRCAAESSRLRDTCSNDWSLTRERDGDQRGRSLAGNRSGPDDPALARPLDAQQLRAARLRPARGEGL